MRVRFWGTRGSLAAPLNATAVRQKVFDALSQARAATLDTDAAIDAFIDNELSFAVRGTFGGNTSCVEIDGGGDEYVICDMGTGLREFGNRVMATPDAGKNNVFNIFMSHLHWDHIMGFPFFVPAYVPGNMIVIHGCHEVLEQAIRQQHSSPNFPVDFAQLGAEIVFVPMTPGESYEVAGLSVRAMKQYHEGDSYGYRFEKDGKAVVYSTDSEHKIDQPEQMDAFVAFFQDADLVVFDAMYSLVEAVSLKEDWGHSSNIFGVELCQRAGAGHLCLFHHEPNNDDATLCQILSETIRFEEISEEGSGLRVSSAYDGLVIDI